MASSRTSAALVWLVVLAAPAPSAAPPPQTRDYLGDPLPRHALARLGTLRWRQQWSVIALACSSDGKALACHTYEDGLGLFDASTGRQQHHLFQGAGGHSTPLAMSADGKRLAACPSKGVVRVWDVRTGEPCGGGAAADVTGLALSPDGKSLVALDKTGKARLLDVATGAEKSRFHGGTACSFGRDGKTLLIGDDRRVRIWNVASGEEVRRLEGEARLLALSADGRTLVASGKRKIRIWDPATGVLRRLVTTPDDELDRSELGEHLTLSAEGSAVALAGHGFVFAWSCATGKELLRVIDQQWHTAAALSADGRTLFGGVMYVPAIQQWDVATGRALFPCPAHENAVQALVFAPDGKSLASGSIDHTVRLWRRAPGGKWAGERVFPIEGKGMRVVGGRVAWSPDGKWLAMKRSDEELCLRDAATGKVVRTFTGPSDCCAIAFSHDSKLLAAGDRYYGKGSNPQGRVFVWEAATGNLVHTFTGHDDIVRSLAFSPDGKTLAAGTHIVHLWDLTTGKLARRLLRGGFVDSLVFTADGRSLIVGGRQPTVWDPATGKERVRLEHNGWVAGVALSPDEKVLATASDDGVVRLLDFPTGKARGELAGHDGRVLAVTFSPDGSVLASAAQDTTILLWDVKAALRPPTGDAPALARQDLDRLWGDLGKADAAAGLKAVWDLVDGATEAVPFLREKLCRPATEGETKRIAGLIADLDDDRFARRQQAEKELDRLAGEAVPALRAARSRKPSPEARKRIDRLLAAHDRRSLPLPAGDALRGVRAIQAIELIGSADARKFLEELADGPPRKLTEDARDALKRWDRRMGGRR